jgi:hypothetical protein
MKGSEITSNSVAAVPTFNKGKFSLISSIVGFSIL